MSFLRRHRYGFPYVLRNIANNPTAPVELLVRMVTGANTSATWLGCTFLEANVVTQAALTPTAPYLTPAFTTQSGGFTRHDVTIAAHTAHAAGVIVDVPPQPFIHIFFYYWPPSVDLITYPLRTDTTVTIHKKSTLEVLHGPITLPVAFIRAPNYVSGTGNKIGSSAPYLSIDPYAQARGAPLADWLIFATS